MNKTSNIIINPLTQRPIKKNGRVYKKLLNEGYSLENLDNSDSSNKYKLKNNDKDNDKDNDDNNDDDNDDNNDDNNDDDSNSDVSLIDYK